MTSMALKLLVASRAGEDTGREQQQLPAAWPGPQEGEHHPSDTRRKVDRGARQASWQEIFLAVTLSRLIDFSRITSFFMIWHFPMENRLEELSGQPSFNPFGVLFHSWPFSILDK